MPKFEIPDYMDINARTRILSALLVSCLVVHRQRLMGLRHVSLRLLADIHHLAGQVRCSQIDTGGVLLLLSLRQTTT